MFSVAFMTWERLSENVIGTNCTCSQDSKLNHQHADHLVTPLNPAARSTSVHLVLKSHYTGEGEEEE